MALNATRLGNAMKDAVDAVGDKRDRAAVFRALATAIITEIVTNGNVFVAVVTTGTAANHTGTGSGSMT